MQLSNILIGASMALSAFAAPMAQPALSVDIAALTEAIGAVETLIPTNTNPTSIAVSLLGEALATETAFSAIAAAASAIEEAVPTGTAFTFASATAAVEALEQLADIAGLEGFSNVTESFETILELFGGDVPTNATGIAPALIEFFVGTAEVLAGIDTTSTDTASQVNSAFDTISGLLTTTTDLIDAILDEAEANGDTETVAFATKAESSLDSFVSGLQSLLNSEAVRFVVVILVKYLPTIIEAISAV